MARKRSKPNYYNLYRKKYSEAKKVLNQLSKREGVSFDSDYYMQVLDTQQMDWKEGYLKLRELMKRTEVLSHTYVKTPDGNVTTLTSDLYDKIMSVPRGYEYSPTEYEENAPRFAEIAVRNFEYELSLYESLIANKNAATGKSKLRSWFDGILKQHGTQAVGLMLMEASNHGLQLGFEVMYDETSATNFINEMTTFLDTTSHPMSEEDKRDIQTEMTDGERLMEDEDGNPIL